MNYRVLSDTIKREIEKSVNGFVTVKPYVEWGEYLTFNISIELVQYGVFWYSFALNEGVRSKEACKRLAAEVVKKHKEKISSIFFKPLDIYKNRKKE